MSITVLLAGSFEVCESFAHAVGDNVQLRILKSHVRDTSDGSAFADAWTPGDDDPSEIDAVFVLGRVDDGETESTIAELASLFVDRSIPFYPNVLFTTASFLSSLIGRSHPVVGVSYVPGLSDVSMLIEAAPALGLTQDGRESALATLGAVVPGEVEVVEDRVGLVSARTVAMIVNEATFAVMEQVATPEDIDTAMELGVNYPKGPLAWADVIGPDVVVDILSALYEEYGEERYRPSVYLKQCVRAEQYLRSDLAD